MEQYVLYLVMKFIIREITDKFSISFNDMDEVKENSIGIFIRGGSISPYRVLATGGIMSLGARVQIIVHGDRSKNGLMNLLSLMSKIRDRVAVSPNSMFSHVDGVSIVDGSIESSEEGVPVDCFISRTSLLGEPTFIGYTKQDLPRYSFNFHVFYSIKEG